MPTLTDSEYEALLAWARAGAEQAGAAPEFIQMRNKLDRKHAVRRYTLIIRVDPAVAVARVGITAAPKGDTYVLELTRPPTVEDVASLLDGRAIDDRRVWVTQDPSGEVGWYELREFPWSQI